MNALDRDIEIGEVVVFEEKYFSPAYQHLAWRLHRVQGGFGTGAHTMGGGLGVCNLADGEQFLADATRISVEETKLFQAKYGKDGSGWPHEGWSRVTPTPPEFALAD